MRPLALAIAIATLAIPAAATAREPVPLADLAETMDDPARQAEVAMTAQAMGEILLDMPVGPMLEALAEAAGEQARTVDRDTTLRKLAPGASALPAEIARRTPQIMRGMGAMAEGLAAMTPALRDMAARMEQALPRPRD